MQCDAELTGDAVWRVMVALVRGVTMISVGEIVHIIVECWCSVVLC